MRITNCMILFSALTIELPAQRIATSTEKTPAATGAPVVALAATGTPSTATLTWQSPPGAIGFDVFRALPPSGTWTKLTGTPILIAPFTDWSGFRFGQAYLYRVVSLFPDGSYGNADLTFQPPAPTNPAWVKATQQGSDVVLSWAPVAGAARYIVAGASAAEGREVLAPHTSVTYANVAAGSYKWIVGARFEPGPMETPATLWPNTALTVSPTFARYRVIITGFSVLRHSKDDPLHYDGRDNEVFVAAQALVLDRKTGALVGKQVSQSMSYGDINNPPRVQAGSSSSHGGLVSGDKVPSADPTQPSGTATATTMPLLVFDGTLADGRDDVLIFPSVWEIDHGHGSVYSDWLSKVPQMRTSAVAAPNAVTGSPFPVFLATGALQFASQGCSEVPDQIPVDRPIGVVSSLTERGSTVFDRTCLFTHSFTPFVFVLQREELERRLATPFVANNGARGLSLSLEFRERADHPFLLGDYLLHLWIERVP